MIACQKIALCSSVGRRCGLLFVAHCKLKIHDLRRIERTWWGKRCEAAVAHNRNHLSKCNNATKQTEIFLLKLFGFLLFLQAILRFHISGENDNTQKHSAILFRTIPMSIWTCYIYYSYCLLPTKHANAICLCCSIRNFCVTFAF